MFKKMLAAGCCLALLLAGSTALATQGEGGVTLGQWIDGAGASMESWLSQSGELNVRATATRAVMPDTATLRLGVTIENTSEQVAQSLANTVIEDTKGALLELGIPEERITTSTYRISRVADTRSTVFQAKTYRASISLTVRLDDFALIGPAIDAAVSQGANDIGTPMYSLSNEGEVYREALADAIRAARLKAEVMAEAAGVSLQTLLSLNEGGTNSVYYSGYSNVYTAEESSGAVTEIQPGEIEVSASVTMTYQIK